jgi:hypothetical protein
MADERNLVVVSPTTVNGKPGRIVTYPDGKIVVQRWTGSGWETDKSRVVAENPPKSEEAPEG